MPNTWASPEASPYRSLCCHLHASLQEGAEVPTKSARGSRQVLWGPPGGLYQFCGSLIQPCSSFIQPALSFLKGSSAGGQLGVGEKCQKQEWGSKYG